MALRKWLKSLRKTDDSAPDPLYLSEAEFTALAPDVLRTLHGRGDAAAQSPLVLSTAQGESYQLGSAYAFYIRTGSNPREVLSAYFALAHSAKDIPTSSHFMVPVVRTSRWLEASAMASPKALPSSPISAHLTALLAFECDGATRFATQADLDRLGLDVAEAMEVAVPNALSSRYALQRAGTHDGPPVWRVRSAVGSPVRALLGGPKFIVALATKIGLQDPLVLVAGANEVYLADFVELGSDQALLRAARPSGTMPPPASLGSVMLTAGPEDEWHELPTDSPDYFSLLGTEWATKYPGADVVYPVPKHDHAGHCAYIAEWKLKVGRSILPAQADLLMVSHPNGTKGWHTMPRRLSDVIDALGTDSTRHEYPAHHHVVTVAQPARLFRRLEKLPNYTPHTKVA